MKPANILKMAGLTLPALFLSGCGINPLGTGKALVTSMLTLGLNTLEPSNPLLWAPVVGMLWFILLNRGVVKLFTMLSWFIVPFLFPLVIIRIILYFTPSWLTEAVMKPWKLIMDKEIEKINRTPKELLFGTLGCISFVSHFTMWAEDNVWLMVFLIIFGTLGAISLIGFIIEKASGKDKKEMMKAAGKNKLLDIWLRLRYGKTTDGRKKCKNCGKYYDEDDNLCEHCGEENPDAAYDCSGCGRKKIPAKKPKCPTCGKEKPGSVLTNKKADPQDTVTPATSGTPCSHCPATVPTGFTQCTNCGAPVTTTTTRRAPPTTSTTTNRTPGQRKRGFGMGAAARGRSNRS